MVHLYIQSTVLTRKFVLSTHSFGSVNWKVPSVFATFNCVKSSF